MMVIFQRFNVSLSISGKSSLMPLTLDRKCHCWRGGKGPLCVEIDITFNSALMLWTQPKCIISTELPVSWFCASTAAKMMKVAASGWLCFFVFTLQLKDCSDATWRCTGVLKVCHKPSRRWLHRNFSLWRNGMMLSCGGGTSSKTFQHLRLIALWTVSFSLGLRV